MTGKSVSSEEKEKYEKEIAEMEELLEEKRKKLHGMKVQRNLLNVSCKWMTVVSTETVKSLRYIVRS